MLKYLLTLLAIGSLFSVTAQIPREPTSALTPNAASLGEYGKIPVSYFTGQSNIQIPLYTVQEGKLSVPLSLSYNASGFRPDEHPGWVGMGWNLAAGGVINRIVNDLPDETDVYAFLSNSRDYGFFFAATHNYLNPTNWATNSYMESLLTGNPSYPAQRDTEPDEFSFSLPGYNGKFYLDHNGNWKVKCDKPVKVTNNQVSQVAPYYFLEVPLPQPAYYSNYSNNLKSFGGFTITTGDGTQYIFGNTTDAIEYSMSFFRQKEEWWTPNSWYLTKVIAPTKQEINLKYERIPMQYINQMYISVYKVLALKVDGGGTLDPNCSYYDYSDNYDSYFWNSGKIIAPVYLTSISCNNVIVKFDRSITHELRYNRAVYEYVYCKWKNGCNNSDPSGELFLPLLEEPNAFDSTYPACLDRLQWQKLDRIRVETPGGEIVKSYDFTYSDNAQNTANRDKQRLTLLSLLEKGKRGVPKPPYQFNYYHSDNNLALPAYCANMNDHWGFYNATTSPLTNAAAHYAARNPTTNTATSLLGILTKITYPTGGKTEFEYEQHRYNKQVAKTRWNSLEVFASDQNAGGLRIKKISSYSADKPNKAVVKEYFYVRGYRNNATNLSSSGVLGGQAQYYFTDYQLRVNGTSSNYYQDVFSSQSVLASSQNAQGSHVGYTEVTEKSSNGGYTKYVFSNFDSAPTGQTPPLDEASLATLQPSRNPYDRYCSREEERGKLLKEIVCTDADKTVKEREISYVALNKNNGEQESVRAINASYINACSGSAPSLHFGVAYKFYTYSYLPVHEEERLYDDNSTLYSTVTKDYDYYDNRLVKNIITSDSKGQLVRTYYKYPDNFAFPTGVPANSVTGVIKSMRSAEKYMPAYPVETITYRGGNVINSQVQTYLAFGTNDSNIQPYQSYDLAVAQPATSYNELQFTGATPTMDANVQRKATAGGYDDKGNVLVLQKENNYPSAYLWGYNNTLPIAKVDNAQPNEIFHSNFEEPGIWDTDLGGYDNTKSHTGRTAGYLENYWAGNPNHSFSTAPLTVSLTADKKYILSGWVYSEGPMSQLWLFMYDANGSGYNYLNVDYTATEETNRWVYLQKEIMVPSGTAKLGVRLTNFYRGSSPAPGKVWFDDIRVYPADAQMTTFTHDPLIGATSTSDAGSRPTYYEYDELQRLKLVRDAEGNIVRHLEYHYQR